MAVVAYTSSTDYTSSTAYTPSGALATVTSITPTVTLVKLDGTTVDVTSYVTRSSGTSSRANSLSHAQPGTAEVVLRNTDRRFDPGYSSGPYYGDIGLGCQIRIDLTPDGGSAQRIYTGEVQSWELDWIGPMSNDPSGTYRGDTHNVRLSCIDALASLASVRSLESLVWLERGDGALNPSTNWGSSMAAYIAATTSNTDLENKFLPYDAGLDTDATGQRTDGSTGRPLWDTHAGTFTVTNDTTDYVAVSATNYARTTIVLSQSTDYAIESEIRFTKGSGATNWPGIIVAGVDNGTMLVLSVNNTTLRLVEYGSGIFGVAENLDYTITTTNTYRVRAIVRGRRVSVAVDDGSGWDGAGYWDLPQATYDLIATAESNYVGWWAHNCSSSRFYDFYVHDAGTPIVPEQRTLERAQTLLGLVHPDSAEPVVADSLVSVDPSGSRGYASCPAEVLQGNFLANLQALERTEYSRGFYADRSGNIALRARYPSSAATTQFTVDWDHTSSSTASYTGLSLGLNWQRYRNQVTLHRHDPFGTLGDLPPPAASDTTAVITRGPRELSWQGLRLDTTTDGDRVAQWLAEGILSDTITDTDEVLYPTHLTIMPGTDSANVATIESVLSAEIGDKITIDYWPVSGVAQVSQDGWIDSISWEIMPKINPTFTFRLTGPYSVRSTSFAKVGTTTANSWTAAY